jgi:hypothetical protein
MFKGKGKIIALVLLIILVISGTSVFVVQFVVPKFKVTNFNGIVSKVYNEDFKLNEVCYGNIFGCKDIEPEIVGEYDLNNVFRYH